MEETLKGGRGPPWAVAPLERERESSLSFQLFLDRMLSNLSTVEVHEIGRAPTLYVSVTS